MTRTAISILIEAHEHGQRLEAHDDKLRVFPANRCSTEFAETLRAHKVELIALLQLPFVMMHSEILDELIFFCEDDETKRSLIAAGCTGVIYTRDELQILLDHNRAHPFVPKELLRLHVTKKLFDAKIEHDDL